MTELHPLAELRSEIIDELMPLVNIAGEDFIVFAQEAAAYPVKGLGHDVADLTSQSSLLMKALERLIG